MHTTAGFIPGGIVSTKALSTTAAKVHLYRALLQSPTDCSFFELVERNELLLPPINISRTDFKRDGYMRTFKAPTNQRDSVPSPIPFDRYYYQKLAYAWNPKARAFGVPKGYSLTQAPSFPFEMADPDLRYLCVTDADESFKAKCDEPIDLSTICIGAETVIEDPFLEFAIEDSLGYYGLISTPRPTEADASRDPQQIVTSRSGTVEYTADIDTNLDTTEPANDDEANAVDERGGLQITTVSYPEDTGSADRTHATYIQVIPGEELWRTFETSGSEPSGDLLEGIAENLQAVGELSNRLSLDPDIETLGFIGNSEDVAEAVDVFIALFANRQKTHTVINAVLASGIE